MPPHLRISWASSIVFALAIVVGSASVSWAVTYHCADGDVQCVVWAVHQANLQPTRRHVITLDPGTYTFQSAENDTDGPSALPSVTGRITIRVLRRRCGDVDQRIRRRSDVPSAARWSGRRRDPTRRGHRWVGGGGGFGGAILNAGGSVDIARSTFRQNSGGSGGALANLDGTMNIASSTFEANGASASVGAAIFNRGVLTVRGTTLSGNMSTGAGAFANFGGTAEIIGTQFVGNRPRLRGPGGLWVMSGSVSITPIDLSGQCHRRIRGSSGRGRWDARGLEQRLRQQLWDGCNRNLERRLDDCREQHVCREQRQRFSRRPWTDRRRWRKLHQWHDVRRSHRRRRRCLAAAARP